MTKHLELLKKYKFDKYLSSLNKKLKNKKVLIYGAGIFFKEIKENYDLSNLNIIGISDKKYTIEQYNKEEMGYRIIPFAKILQEKPEYVLIATLNTFVIYKTLKDGILKNTKIKILPLVDKPFFELLREVLG